MCDLHAIKVDSRMTLCLYVQHYTGNLDSAIHALCFVLVLHNVAGTVNYTMVVLTS